jgi:hypothetical protein
MCIPKGTDIEERDKRKWNTVLDYTFNTYITAQQQLLRFVLLQLVVNTNKSYAAIVEFVKAHIQSVLILTVAYFGVCMGQMFLLYNLCVLQVTLNIVSDVSKQAFHMIWSNKLLKSYSRQYR